MWHFQAVTNFRDIGGHRTANGRRMRSGQFFRSGHLADATDHDLELLQQIGIRTVFDLQHPSDVAFHGEDRLPPAVNYRRIPCAAENDSSDISRLIMHGSASEVTAAFPPGTAYALMVETYGRWATDEGRASQLRDVLCHIIEQDDPVLIHCSAGKDRTGFVSALMQLTAGVDEQVVTADYLNSNEGRSVFINEVLSTFDDRGVPRQLLEPLLVQRHEYIGEFLTSLTQTWETPERYLRDGLGLSAPEVAALRARLLA